MRFLRTMGAAQAVPDGTLVERLRAVTHRGKVEEASYPLPEEPAEVEGQQKVFWTPGEAAADKLLRDAAHGIGRRE